MPDPLTRLQLLERTVAGLLARNTGGETLVPNTYSVDSGGNVNVSGVNIPAGTSATPLTRSKIRWIRQSDGAVVAEEYGYSSGGLEALLLVAQAAAHADQSELALGAIDDDLAYQAEVIIQQANRGATASVSAFAGAAGLTLLNQSGSSDLLQKAHNLSDLSSAAAALLNLGIARGTAGVTFSASTVSAVTTVSHGLSGTPTVVLATMQGAGGLGVPVTGSTTNYTGTTFDLYGRTPTSNSSTFTLCWLAVL